MMNIENELFEKFHDFLASEFGCDVAYNLDTRDIECVINAMNKAYNQGKEDEAVTVKKLMIEKVNIRMELLLSYLEGVDINNLDHALVEEIRNIFNIR